MATATQPFRIALIDDHAVVRQGLQALIERDPDVKVVGQAADGRTGRELVASLKPDIVIIDVTMPNLNGVDATRMLMRDNPRMRVIALSMHTDTKLVLAMLDAGAMGYVAKESAADEILRAIHAVGAGRMYVSSDVASPVIESVMNRDPEANDPSQPGKLAPREREVLQLLAEGMTSATIAHTLNLSVHTVDTHRRNIMRKTRTHSIAELTKLAIREGMTSL